MNLPRILLVSSLAGAAALAVFIGCNAPDPAAFQLVERDPNGNGPAPPSATTPTPTGAKGDPVFGTDVFAYVDPGLTADSHDGTHIGQKPMEGKNCVKAGCHAEDAQHWSFAGTVYQSISGNDAGAGDAGPIVPHAEIRIVDPTGKEFGRAYTDVNGNFWLSGKPGDYPPPGSKVGVRREGGNPLSMVATISGQEGAGCNSDGNCHGQPAVRIYAP